MKDFDRGAKRKCTSCSTLFFDLNRFPIICPSCGAEVNTLLTNVSKRGRPPKSPKIVEDDTASNEMKIDDINVEEPDIEDINSDDGPVEDMIEIKREEDST